MVEVTEAVIDSAPPSADIFAFRFDDGEVVALQRNRQNIITEHNGCRFTAWWTAQDFVDRLPEATTDELPSRVTVDDVDPDDGMPSMVDEESIDTKPWERGVPVESKYIEAIAEYVNGR